MSTKIVGDGDITGATNVKITGAMETFFLPAVPTGYIRLNGGTIGSATSGANNRADNDTQALFAAWWSYLDAQLPIQTSAGGPSTRGASAAADWAANKRLSVFDLTDDTFPVQANGTTVNGTKYSDQMQGHWHNGEAAVVGNTSSPFNAMSVGGSGTFEFLNGRAFRASSMVNDGTNGVPRIGAKTLPPRIGALVCVKL